MPYATLQDMVDRFGEAELAELTNREPGATSVNEDVLGKALADADAEIDSYIAGRYGPLPLAVIPTVLIQRACDLARWFLYGDRPTDTVTARYNAAIAWLKGVARGEVSLNLSATNQDTRGSDLPVVSSPERAFTGDSLKGFVGS